MSLKKLSILILIFLIPAFILAQNERITVNLEPAKSSYTVGEVVKIKWSFSGFSDPNSVLVKITLWRENATRRTCRIGQDIELTRGTTGINWTVPDSCLNREGNNENLIGGRFRVRVRWQGHTPAVFGESSYFTIIEQQQPIPSITEVSLDPDRNAYTLEDRVRVRWNYENASSGTTVVIALVRGGQTDAFCFLSRRVRINLRSWRWDITRKCIDPETGRQKTIPEGNYKIRVKISSNNNFRDSRVFALSWPPIDLVFPSQQYKTYYLGDVIPISWIPIESGGNIGFILYKEGNFFCTITSSVPISRGHYNWQIPSTCGGKTISSGVYELGISGENIRRSFGIRTYPIHITNIKMEKTQGGAEVSFDSSNNRWVISGDSAHKTWKLVVTTHYMGATGRPGLPSPSGRKNVPLRLNIDNLPGYISISRNSSEFNINPGESQKSEFLLTGQNFRYTQGRPFEITLRLLHSTSGIILDEESVRFTIKQNESSRTQPASPEYEILNISFIAPFSDLIRRSENAQWILTTYRGINHYEFTVYPRVWKTEIGGNIRVTVPFGDLGGGEINIRKIPPLTSLPERIKVCVLLDSSSSYNYSGIRKRFLNALQSDPDGAFAVKHPNSNLYKTKFWLEIPIEEAMAKIGTTSLLKYKIFVVPDSVSCGTANLNDIKSLILYLTLKYEFSGELREFI